jgi:hypothetical protein
VQRKALLDFAGLFRGMDVQRNTVRGRPFHDRWHVLDGHSSHRVQCGADQDGRVGTDLLSQRLDALGPPVATAVTEPLLRSGQR